MTLSLAISLEKVKAKPMTEILDPTVIAQLKSLLSDDFLKEVIRIFQNNAGELVKSLQNELERGDHKNIESTARNLMQLAQSMGAEELATVARCLSVDSHSLSHDNRLFFRAKIAQVLDNTSRELAKW